MSKTIAVLAPNYDPEDPSGYNSDIVVRYKDESPLFNLRFTSDQRLQLCRMRKDLTVQIMDDAPVGERSSTLTKMIEIMGLSEKRPSEVFVRNISVGTG